MSRLHIWHNSLTFPILSLSLTLSIQLKKPLILPFILINYSWLLFLKTSDCISIDILTIPLNSGIVLTVISGHSMYWLTMTQNFNLNPLYPCKMLWDFSKKEECNNYIKNWQMSFQTSNFKGKYFLNLLDDELDTIEP